MRPDIVHAHLTVPSMYAAVLRGLGASPPVVVTYHNLAYDARPPATSAGRAKKALHRLLMRWLVSSHIAVSDPVRSHYTAHLGLREMTVIPNGFVIDDFPRVAQRGASDWRRRAGTDGAAPSIVCPATFRIEKITISCCMLFVL